MTTTRALATSAAVAVVVSLAVIIAARSAEGFAPPPPPAVVSARRMLIRPTTTTPPPSSSSRIAAGSLFAYSSSSSSSSSSVGGGNGVGGVGGVGRINTSIDIDSAKVVTQAKLLDDADGGGTKKAAAYCRCWKSGTFPLCDGGHAAHNGETGDNVGPLILSIATTTTTTTTTSPPPPAAAEVVVVAIAPSEMSSSFSSSSSSYSPTTTNPPVVVVGGMRAFLRKLKGPDDGMTTRERLGKMGLSALLSYGFVSNMSYAVSVSLAWYGFSKRTGTSPLAPGQWKPFLAVYAGFYVFNNIVRPLRLGASVVVAKYFDAFVDIIQRRTGLPRKWSVAAVVFLANVCGTFAAMGFGISLASGAAGVPIFPPKA